MKNKIPSLFSISESENETARDREREVKMKKNLENFSRNQNLAGVCKESDCGTCCELCAVKVSCT